jgi:formamidopyrimidine-DNA glycosylase
MPELPEVETVRRHLQRRVPGRIVRSVWISGKPLRKPISRGFSASFQDGRFTRVRRIGKFLYLDWESRDGRTDRSLLAHLGMTGRFVHRRPGPEELPPHTHAAWTFEDGSSLLFCDARRFGLLQWVARDRRPDNVGLDPTESPLSGVWLWAELKKSRAPIKAFLLDQRRIAGLGNIYACEALFRAGISPRRRSLRLTASEADRLAEAIRSVLAEAVRYRGTTLSDFRDLDDRPGDYGSALHVYDREGQPCGRCQTGIRRLVQSGRSTFYCPRCQRATRGERTGSQPSPPPVRKIFDPRPESPVANVPGRAFHRPTRSRNANDA